MREFLNIPYTHPPRGELNAFDLYIPDASESDPPSAPSSPSLDTQQSKAAATSAPSPLICFVHGGAWRSEDKSRHAALARRLAQSTSYAVAVPNYRLTNPKSGFLKHPAHTEDLLAFLQFVSEWEGPGDGRRPGGPEPETEREPERERRRPYDSRRIYVLGHSCSAHMLTSILLSPPQSSPSPFPTLEPSPQLLAALKGVVLSEGIYDLDLLIRSFPGYREWFVENTFGPRSEEKGETYEDVNTTRYELREGARHVRWMIVHSSGDTLVDRVQSESMVGKLREELARLNGEESGIGSVQTNWELKADHNDILTEDEYPRIVSAFVRADV